MTGSNRDSADNRRATASHASARASASRLDGVQAARAVAAISVVVTHGIAHPLQGAPGVAHLLGRYGVALFFVISGYIMVRSTGSGVFDPLRFLFNRIRRIVPLYWIACAALAIFALISPGSLKTTVFETSNFIKSLLFIPEFQANGSGNIWPFFRLGWTLNYEMFFYTCFALTFMLKDLTRTIVLSAFFMALILYGANMPVSSAPAVFYTRVDTIGFVAGMWVAVFDRRGWTLKRPAAIRLAWTVSLVSLAAIAILYAQIKDNPWTQVWLIASCMPQIAMLAAPVEPGRFRTPRSLVFLGDASYAIYLWHMFGVAVVTTLVHRFAPQFVYYGMGLAAVFGLVFGILAHLWIEVPLNRWLRRGHLTRADRRMEPPPLSPADGL